MIKNLEIDNLSQKKKLEFKRKNNFRQKTLENFVFCRISTCEVKNFDFVQII